MVNFYKLKKLFLLLIFLALNFPLVAQLSKGDSILFYLQQVKGSQKTDSTFLLKTFDVMSQIQIDSVLLNKTETEIKRIEKLCGREIAMALRLQLCRFLFIGISNSETIDLYKSMIESLKDYNTVFEKYMLINMLADLRIPYRNSNRINEGIEYFLQMVHFFESKNDSEGISMCYYSLRGIYGTLGLTDKAIYCSQKSLQYLNDRKPYWNNYFFQFGDVVTGLLGILNRKAVLASLYVDIKLPQKALPLLYESKAIYESNKDSIVFVDAPFVFLQLAKAKILLNDDSVIYYMDFSRSLFLSNDYAYFSIYYQLKGNYYYLNDQLDSAAYFIQKSEGIKDSNNTGINTFTGVIIPGYYKSLIFIKQKKYADAIQNLTAEIEKLKAVNLRKEVLKELNLLASVYKLTNDFKNATLAHENYETIEQAILKDEEDSRHVSFEIEQRLAEKEKQMASLEAENVFRRKNNLYLLGIVLLIAITAGVIYNRYRVKNKSNQQLSVALQELKNTQQQLVQQEKLASLGALTAGIAHEIKNPLNFVNNFSELSSELVDEFLEAKDDDERREIAVDLKQNLEKINQHGKRADSIVKNMLEHSRSGKSEKQAVNLNNLSSEYFNLAYHGMRANNPNFNCEMKLDLAENLAHANVVSQDISRVILNLFNNAFYAVAEKKRESENTKATYNPTVSLTTQQQNNSIIIRIRDNGKGIPSHIKEKIFEPFFTTKPTGQGTGLGLSLSYDIIKAHGGELKVESKENEFTEFIITLPV